MWRKLGYITVSYIQHISIATELIVPLHPSAIPEQNILVLKSPLSDKSEIPK